MLAVIPRVTWPLTETLADAYGIMSHRFSGIPVENRYKRVCLDAVLIQA